jgi:trehalose synthase
VPRPANVDFTAQPLERYGPVLNDDFAAIREVAELAREFFRGRTLWQINSTALGGGVAEMLRAFLPYAVDSGVDTRWVVINGTPDFFTVTKRIHNKLHGHPGDGGSLGQTEQLAYREVMDESLEHLLEQVRPDDVVFLHDPQTAGLIQPLNDAGAITLWRCHVGIDEGNEHVEEAIEFLVPFVRPAHGYVFSRPSYSWPQLPEERIHLMAPAIDAFSPKNQELSSSVVNDILTTIGLSGGQKPSPPPFLRSDGSSGLVEREAEILQLDPVPPDAFLITQISRWDVLKDFEGVLEAFIRYLADTDAHLALVGPSSGAVSDDPEGPAVHARITATWEALPDDLRARVHVVNLPMDDFDENGAMVNAIQRRSDVIIQKSLVEGFGLTVSEAMWKGKPVIGSAVGGIQDQIVDGESGILIRDPADLEEFAAAVRSLIDDPELASALGDGARARVAARFLAAPRIAEYVNVIGQVQASRALDVASEGSI